MKLSKLLKNINIKYNNDIDIKGISIDSRKIKKDYLFIAIKGFDLDGHKFINSAINNGANTILIDEDRYNEFKDLNIEILTYKNTRDIVPYIACNFYNNPSKEFKLIGVTGTKGKTTTTFMIKNILEKSNHKVGLIGTVASYIGEEKLNDSDRTTPEAIELQELFRKMADEKCEYVVIEVSSQSLKLGRVNGSKFDLCLFTNLSEDHISKNEHPTMEDYFMSKAKLFDMTNNAFTNIDDVKGRELISLKPNCNFKTYSIYNNSDKKATNIKIDSKYTSFDCNIYNKNEHIVVDIPGEFTIYNSLGAISVCEYFNIDSKYIINGLKDIQIPGRSEMVKNKLGLNIMIDYAHSENSLLNILKSARIYTKGKIICVFGCGGNRDNNKRPKMGEIAGKYADYTIITSDNPREEDPVKIINDIEVGIKKITNNYEIIVNRIDAIKKAISIATKDDLILLAGKGHETYQIVGKTKYPFDERKIIKDIINGDL